MNNMFSQKVAIVTGGASGIGRAAAISFASRGAKVVVADWMNEEKHETVEAIKAAGGEATFVKCNVAVASEVKAMIDYTISTYGRLDFAFNNAGVEGEMAPLQDCSEENWDRTIDINLKGVWLCMKYELLHMRSHERGVIVNCSSIAGLKGFVNLPAYVASKHGVVGLTKTAALENAEYGIRINAVCPGVIKTAMVDRITHNDAETEQEFIKMEPVGRMGLPEEVAGTVMWLCSEDATFVTGDAVAVDGGCTA